MTEQIQPTRGFAGSYHELLESWINGVEIAELRSRFEDQLSAAEDLGSLVDEWFGYRLPWGIAGYIRISSGTLNLDESDLSPVARYLPSMVKWGVPTQYAVWAMTVGIPLRSLAIALSAEYRANHPDGGFGSFLDWLGTLQIEQLRRRFELSDPLLESIARVLHQARPSPLLKHYVGVAESLPLTVRLEEIGQFGPGSAAVLTQPGERVELRRDYANLFDRNSVLVYTDAGVLGAVPRDAAQLLAPEMDAGFRVDGTIIDVDRRAEIGLTVEIDAAESPLFG